MQDGPKHTAGFGLEGGEVGFQLVAQSHPLIGLGNVAVLFGEGRDWINYFRQQIDEAP